MHVNRLGHERTEPYTSERELAEGDLLHHAGRDWLVAAVEGERVRLEPARYRLRVRPPPGRGGGRAVPRPPPPPPPGGPTLHTGAPGAAGRPGGARPRPPPE